MSALPLEEVIAHHLLHRGVTPVGTERELLRRAVEEIVELREELARRSQWTGDGLLVALFAAAAESADHFAIDATGKGRWFAGPPTLNYHARCWDGRGVTGPVVVMSRERAAETWKRLCWARPASPVVPAEAEGDYGGPLVAFGADGAEAAA